MGGTVMKRPGRRTLRTWGCVAHVATLVLALLLVTATPPAKAQNPGKESSLRVTVSYSCDKESATLKLLSVEEVRTRPPPSVDEAPSGSGFYYELRNGDEVLYRNIIVSPFGLRQDVEVSNEQRFRCSYSTTERCGILPLIVPNDPRATRIVYRYRPSHGTEEERFSVAIDEEAKRELPSPPPEERLAPDAEVDVLQWNGPPEGKLNLVILGDGYTESQIPKFRGDANDFWEHLQNTPPFNRTVKKKKLHEAFNVYRIDVVSREDGADVNPGCGPQVVHRDTYFNAGFCKDGHMWLLSVDRTLAQKVVKNRLGCGVPDPKILVIVNSDIYGGYGDHGVSITSTGVPPDIAGIAQAAAEEDTAKLSGAAAPPPAEPYWLNTAIHELGHTIFRLGDEYGIYKSEPDGALEPTYENVTLQDTLEGLKKKKERWYSLLESSVLRKCAEPQPPAVPPANVVGLFEGASWYHCGFYRPQLRCKMRDQADPFCVVCTDVIVEELKQYVP